MRLTHIVLTAATALALTGIADARVRGVPPATPDGEPKSCVPLNSIRETRVRDDSTIDFYMRGGKVYRNALPNRCPQLGFEQSFFYSTSLPSLCSTDIITVMQRPSYVRGASCGLGQFQPVTGLPR